MEAAQDLTLLTLFLRATIVVKLVMLMLLAASVWSWAIIIDRLLVLRKNQDLSDRFEAEVWSGKPFDEIYEDLGTERPSFSLARLFTAAMREIRVMRDKGAMTEVAARSLKERIDRVMEATSTREISRLERGLGVLAIIATASPFIGLFGTVWGIMHAFESIAAARDTSLAVVAPGIAEALFATAMGLFAAIPAYMFYNGFTTRIGRFSDRMQAFCDEFYAFLSRRM